MAKAKEKTETTLSLSFSERLFRIGLLYPKETNILNGIILKDIKTKVAMSSSDVEKFDAKPVKEVGGLNWETKNDKTKSITFTNPEMMFLKDQVSRLDKQNKITQDMLEVVLKIREA